MNLLDNLISVVAPHRCVGCDKINQVLCRNCSAAIVSVPPRCYRCLKATKDYKTCKSCRSSSYLRSVKVLGEYDDVIKSVLHGLKYQRNQAAAGVLAGKLAGLSQLSGLTLVPVPTSPSRVRQRGYDQAELLAKRLAYRTNSSATLLLKRIGLVHQIGASGVTRRKQLSGVFSAKPVILKNVVLIDDVLTTGATLEEAAKTLRVAGVKTIDAIVVAQA